MDNPKAILFLLPDCPGYFTELMFKMGATVKSKGYIPVYASTTPFYEKFKNISLSAIGKVYYLDQFLNSDLQKEQYEHFSINNWSYYASFSRQTYFFKKFLPSIETLKKSKLFFQTILNENPVALLISEGVSNSFLYLAHEQASARNIPYFGLMGARLPYHFNVHVDVVGNEVLLNRQSPDKYIPSDAVPDYMKNSQYGGLFDKNYSLLSFSFLKEFFQFIFLRSYHSLETGNTKRFLLKVYRIALKRILSHFYFRNVLKIYQFQLAFGPDKIYVVYPLHFYPEASTSIYAKYYDGNEYDLIKNIAFSLPENAVLIVKEHKANAGNNNLKFYERIKKLPNTILLDPHFNLKDNLAKFDAVVTISSTVGFEALTQNVPVYVLGEVFYQNYPGSHKINSYAELEKALRHLQKKALINTPSPANDIYFGICFPGSFNYMDPNCLNEDNVGLLLKPALEFLETNDLPVHRNDK